MFRTVQTFCIGFIAIATLSAEWRVQENSNAPDSGRRLDVQLHGQMVAQLVFGEGQLKPYLHIYGRPSDLLTKWTPDQQFPHHRGIYIGWNKIKSDLGIDDLWHLHDGEKFEVVKVREARAFSDHALLVIETAWRSKKKDDTGNDILINEVRTVRITRPREFETQVDFTFRLKPARDLRLDGDLQHSGIHFRGAVELSTREMETSYLWEPNLDGPGGKVQSKELQWARLIFPIGNNWYTATDLNAPSNPVEELSWRSYGRFGFFFKRDLKKDEELTLNYRFITKPTKAPALQKHNERELRPHRKGAQKQYSNYVTTLTKPPN